MSRALHYIAALTIPFTGGCCWLGVIVEIDLIRGADAVGGTGAAAAKGFGEKLH
jgi:hypothetical protein